MHRMLFGVGQFSFDSSRPWRDEPDEGENRSVGCDRNHFVSSYQRLRTRVGCDFDRVQFAALRALSRMQPILVELKNAGVPIRHVDVGSEPHLATRYGIRQTPTFVVVSGGKNSRDSSEHVPHKN